MQARCMSACPGNRKRSAAQRGDREGGAVVALRDAVRDLEVQVGAELGGAPVVTLGGVAEATRDREALTLVVVAGRDGRAGLRPGAGEGHERRPAEVRAGERLAAVLEVTDAGRDRPRRQRAARVRDDDLVEL